MKASGHKTPQPSPAIHSAILRAQGVEETQGYIGTPDRLSTLRERCLARDRHRCAISRQFDQTEALARLRAYGDNAKDDDGTLLREETAFEVLEVAHILPHALTKADASLQMVCFPVTMVSFLAQPYFRILRKKLRSQCLTCLITALNI